MASLGYDGADTLASLAGRLNPHNQALPALFAFTDPVRTPDPLALAERLPLGSGLIFRSFGQTKLKALAAPLAALCQARGVMCLIAAEPELAQAVGADGVHWPQARLTGAAVRCSSGLISTSVHSPQALRRAQRLADLAFVSAVFASNSPSAGRAMGVFRARTYTARTSLPVYALGGVNMRTVKRLNRLGISGVGAVEAI